MYIYYIYTGVYSYSYRYISTYMTRQTGSSHLIGFLADIKWPTC